YLEMVEVPKGFNRRAFTQDVSALVARYHDLSGGRMAMGTALLELTKLGYRHRAPVPGGVTLMGKAMLNLDGTLRALAPKLDPVALIRDYMLDVMQKRIAAGFSPGRLFAWVLDMKHLAENTPRRADLLLDKLANDQFTLRLDVEQLENTAKTLNRAAARLSLSLVASALIVAGGFVGGALLRRGDGGAAGGQ